MNRIGEVLEAGTTEFRAACDTLHCPPAFGSLVRASNGFVDVLGIVYDATTAAIDPGRPAVVRGKDAPDEASVYRKHPQLEQLLRTDIRAVTVGFLEDGVPIQYLPDYPPRLHAFVYLLEPETTTLFYRELGYLGLLTTTRVPAPVDELIAASLRHALAVAPNPDQQLVAAGKELIVLLGGDPVRLKMILQRVNRRLAP